LTSQSSAAQGSSPDSRSITTKKVPPVRSKVSNPVAFRCGSAGVAWQARIRIPQSDC
jgi:hypothetical protein